MQKRRFLFLPALITLVVLLVGCKGQVVRIPVGAATSIPSNIGSQVGKTPEPALPEKRLVVLEWPQQMREQDSDIILLSIEIDDAGQLTPTVQGKPGTPIEIPNLYETHNIFALARLDLAGMNALSGDIREPLRPGKPVAFRWSIRAEEPGMYRGVVWLHIEMIPKAGGQAEQQLILARPIEIQAVTVFGLPPILARWMGSLGLVASTALGYPFIQRWLEPLFKRRTRAISWRKTAPAPGEPSLREEVPGPPDPR